MNEVEKINIICDKQITNNDINIKLYDIIIEYNYFYIINVHWMSQKIIFMLTAINGYKRLPTATNGY